MRLRPVTSRQSGTRIATCGWTPIAARAIPARTRPLRPDRRQPAATAAATRAAGEPEVVAHAVLGDGSDERGVNVEGDQQCAGPQARGAPEPGPRPDVRLERS